MIQPTFSPAALVLLVAAVLAVVFEAVGAGVGERKQVPRVHQQVLLVVAGVLVVGLSLLKLGPAPIVAVAVAACLAAFAVGEGSDVLGDRSALALGLAAATVVAVPTAQAGGVLPPLTAVAWAACATVVFAGLSMRAGVDAAVEAAARQAFIGGAAVVMLGLALLVPGAASTALTAVALAIVVGLVPMQGPRVDLAHGASAGVAALAGLTLLTLGPTLAHAVAKLGPDPAQIVVVVGLCGLPLVALNQRSVARVFAVLAALQTLLPVAAVVVGKDPRPAAAVGVLGVVALALARAALPGVSTATASWEDVSGTGRLAPWRSGLVVFAAAHACGLFPTAGYTLRKILAADVDVSVHWMPAVLFGGAALAALPIVRLALFLFAKTPRHRSVGPSRVSTVMALCVVVALAVWPLLWPALLAP